ncbi:Cas1p-domain-containing protein [Thelephora terrestris]|uniref:Cas1p-domain-containing protein n=1 Tax=Thelephora terrestris TaxID=56493 RepID=A0A9P6L8Z6_9AGAM|nr:Cas1p-domain-containing protein [Thelephora terrestris]
MGSSRRLQVHLNPLFPQYLSLFFICSIVILGLAGLVLDQSDPLKCYALLHRGRWLDSVFKNWQPDGCMLNIYTPQDTSTCFRSRQVVFVGDSITRQLFFQFANIVDPKLPDAPPDDDHKHSNYTLDAENKVQLSFYWDPYMNSSYSRLVHPTGTDRAPSLNSDRPALLVLGTGLWYLRNQDSGGLPAWEARVEAVIETIRNARPPLADQIVFLPVEEPVISKLSPERANTIRISDVDAMNSDLFHRIYSPHDSFSTKLLRSPHRVSLSPVLNHMLHDSQTTDGLHFSTPIIKAQANLLLNFRCNDFLPKRYPMDKTCCRSYPSPSWPHFFVISIVCLVAPVSWYYSYHAGKINPATWISDEHRPVFIMSGAVALMYVADRTSFWFKEQKQFDPWFFGSSSVLALLVGLATVKRADKDLGFLNREQTDEWKGWMQIAILIYHYTGASKISGIYNPIRVLVAAYLFMTGYGHTVFYVKKADYGFLRIAQVMVRLNLLTIILAYVMNTDYLFYYFAPLVSFWYIVVYVTMAIGSQYNDRTVFLICKVLAAMSVTTFIINEEWILKEIFSVLEGACNIPWSAKESSFRLQLDYWIVYFGMLTAIAYMKVRDHRLTDHPLWPMVVKVSIGVSAVGMVWFFAFELLQPSKFTYNHWHPYISWIPVISFAILRNANPTLRSASSQVFGFIGKCSLETFIMQYHLWLAADTKGLLIVIPWTRWRIPNVIVTTTIFVWLSNQVAQATTVFTGWICGSGKGSEPSSLPTHNANANANTSVGGGSSNMLTPSGRTSATASPSESLPLITDNDQDEPKDGSGERIPFEPDTPIRPVRWVDRLAESPATTTRDASSTAFLSRRKEWPEVGLVGRLSLGLVAMWILNLMWPAAESV